MYPLGISVFAPGRVSSPVVTLWPERKSWCKRVNTLRRYPDIFVQIYRYLRVDTLQHCRLAVTQTLTNIRNEHTNTTHPPTFIQICGNVNVKYKYKIYILENKSPGPPARCCSVTYKVDLAEN